MRNVFAVISGVLITPPLSRGLLPGITRVAVLELAGQNGLPCAEGDLPLSDLPSVEECFLSSSLAEILPVAFIDSTPLPTVPGPVTRRMTSVYRELVTRETRITVSRGGGCRE